MKYAFTGLPQGEVPVSALATALSTQLQRIEQALGELEATSLGLNTITSQPRAREGLIVYVNAAQSIAGFTAPGLYQRRAGAWVLVG